MNEIINPIATLTGLEPSAIFAGFTTLAGFVIWYAAAYVRSLCRRTPNPTAVAACTPPSPPALQSLSDLATLILQRLDRRDAWGLTPRDESIFADGVLSLDSAGDIQVNGKDLDDGDLQRHEMELIYAKANAHRLRLLNEAEATRVAALFDALTRPDTKAVEYTPKRPVSPP